MSYTHLTLEERILLEELRKGKRSIRAIAEELGRSPSTISRELRRNQRITKRHRRYFPHNAQRQYEARIRQDRIGKFEQAQLADYVQEKLLLAWSPEQIAGRMALDFPDAAAMRIAHGTIYRWLKRERIPRAKEARKYLRHYGRTYGDGRGKLQGVRELKDRPVEVQRRERFGDWEMDTMVSKEWGPCLLTLCERKSQYCGVVLLKERTTKEVGAALNQFFSGRAHVLKTLTSDRGKEFYAWRQVEQDLNVRQYFTRPYSPWQKGCVENLNGLIRQFFPKRTSFKHVSANDVQRVMILLNHRPRKRLLFKTPHEVLLLI